MLRRCVPSARRLLIVTLVAWLVGATSQAAAGASETIDAGALVTKVDAAGKQLRVTIDRGAKSGVKVGATGELYPMRIGEGRTTSAVDYNVRLALGRVVSVRDHDATLALEAVADTVTTGAYFAYKVAVPREHAESVLLRVTARAIEMRPQYTDVPFVTFETLLVDASPAAVDRVLDAMIADVKAMKSVVVDTLKTRIEEGKHHGKSAGQVVDELDRAQLLDFLLFVEAFAGSYIGHRWKLPEVYFTWVINGTLSGEKQRKLRAASTTIAAAKAAATAGKLDEARAHWKKVLESVPDHEDASAAIKRIDRILLLTRRNTADPDDTAAAYDLMNELFNLGAYDLALVKNEALRKRGYDPVKVDRMRAFVLVRKQKWKEAEQVFGRLAGKRPNDTQLANWSAYARAQAKLARAPNDPALRMELAAVNYASKSWDAALTEYRKVLESTRATAKQREAVKLAQERISLQKDLDESLGWLRADIRKHDLKTARDRIAQLVRLADRIGDPKQAANLLDDLAQQARTVNEEELALELLTKRVQALPDNQSAHTSLAYALLGFDRIDEAEVAAKQSLTLKGDPAYSYLILAYVARSRGDLAEAEKLATKASKDSPTYPWPLLTLARAEAARGNWDAAMAHARRALELNDGEYEIRATHEAVSRGLQAHEALQANPASPRERLRMVRALAGLGLVQQVTSEIAKLPVTDTWRSEGWWALADSTDPRVLLRDRLAAARSANPSVPSRMRYAAELEARARLRANPKDDATRIELARLYIKSDSFHAGLATLVPLMTQPLQPAVGDLVRDAREGLTMDERLELARAASARGDFEGAIRLSLAAQQVYDRIGTKYGRLTTREVRAGALGELGRVTEAIAVIEEARTLALADGDPKLISICDQKLGQLRAQIGTNDALHAALEAARVQFEDLDDYLSLYYVLLQLGRLEGDEGHSAEALEHARRAWNIADRLGRADMARDARFDLADASLTSSRFSDAEQIALKLLADCRKREDMRNEQGALMVLGVVALNRGQGKAARARFQEVYELGTRTGQTGWRAVARRFEGSAYLRADHDPAKAAVALEQAAELYASMGEGWANTVRGSALRELADARLQAGKLASARQAAEQSFALAQRFQRRPALASAQWILALIALAEKKPDEAMTHAKDAVAGAEKTDDAALLWNAWHALARAHEQKSQDQEAVAAYEKSLAHLGRALQAAGGESEREGYMNTGRVREVYKDAIERFLKSGNTTRAMEILELSRDALLRQQFDATKVHTKDAALRARLDRVDEARARVKGLQKQLDDAMAKPVAQRNDAQVKALGERIAKTRQELNQVVLDLKVTHRHLFQALAMEPQNLADRRHQLPAGSVLVEYFVAGDALYAFVIAASLSQPAVVRVKVASSELEQTIGEFREALVDDSEKKDTAKRVEALGRKLDDWLLEPLRPHLEGASTVIVLPFGPLYYLPFDALVVSAPGAPVRYAIEDFRISIQTASTLERLLEPKRARSAGTMLAVANPDGSLPGAAREVSRIVKTALPDAQVLGKNQATVKKFVDMAGGFRYLHIATHGVLDADPRKSHLKLADGPLTVQQIAQVQGLDQGNELVVLSACDTAMEQGHSTGDELVSVAVAFSMAGSPALVASLWEVGDDSTAELMATFYRALEQTSGDRLDALRNAKLNLLRMQRGKDRPFASPWHWSSFQLYGDFRALAAAAN